MRLLLLSAAPLGFLSPQGDLAPRLQDSPLRIGETIRGVLGPSPSGSPARVFELVAETTGPLTILLESYDFDALLRVEREGGEVVAEDDNAAVETNARLVLGAGGEARYRILASTVKGGSGEFTLTIVPGEAPRPSGVALLDAGIAFRSKAAERALARGDGRGAAAHLMEEGKKRYSLSQFPQARLAFETALDLHRGLGDRAGEAAALGNLGTVQLALGDAVAARERHEESLALFRERGDRVGEAKGLCNLGLVFQSLGDVARARECHERDLALSRALGDRGGEATALGNLGTVSISAGDYAGAREILERHLLLARELGDRAGEARALGNLGIVHGFLGDSARARECHERDLALVRALGDRAGEAKALGNLGNVFVSIGDYSKAREYHEDGLALSRELGDRAGETKALGNLGEVQDFLGDYEKAREVDERHLALARETGNREEEAPALLHLGDVHGDLGDLATARARYEESLSRFREIGHRVGEAAAIGNLGGVCLSVGDYARAREYDENSLALAREIGDRAGEAGALGSLGHAYATLGDPARARECHEQSLALAREIGDRSAEARALDNLGTLCASLGDLARARPLARAALALYEEMGVVDRTLYSLQTLARAALADRNAAEALGLLRRADRALEQPFLDAVGPREATGWRSRWSPWAEVAQDLTALRAGEGAELAARSQAIAEGFREAGRWKGRTLLEGIAEHRAGGRTADVIRLRGERRETLAARDRALERVSQAIGDRRPVEEVEALREDARALLSKAQELARGIAEISPRDAALDAPAGAEPDAVRGLLGAKTALVEYAEGEKRLYAYVLTERDLVFLDLGDRGALQGDVEEYLSFLTSLEPAVAPREIAAAGRALFERLLAPVLRQGKEGVERLVVVPTGALAGLPFEALVMPGSGERFADLAFVGDRYEVSYAPSSPVLVELAALGIHRGGERALVLADPVYPPESAAVAVGGPAGSVSIPPPPAWRAAPDASRLPRLANTRREGLDLARLLLGPGEEEARRSLERLSGERSGSLSLHRVDLHLGRHASRLRLRGDLRAYSVLHLATHGSVDREFPERTGIALSSGEGEEGFFAIADALELDLDADLVVLSGCQTARGEVRAGEGVESIARAFLYAGARGVVASLWRVEERTAVETMEAFYRRALEEGLSPSRALREAKLAVRRSGDKRGAWSDAGPGAAESGHPFFWAPFVYIGSLR
ncbi:MAG TPA: CHAT domain-containing tetratricopeptide repeat protein [Planctomycetota bacterium]|jgi:CHAT domain-containing protein/Tfp pilus assembly protein PilF|nr:CHAT domain-containing tetratricopeptide repeat protein [Planctomycetota bacterium]